MSACLLTAMLAAAPGEDDKVPSAEQVKALEACDPLRMVGRPEIAFRVLPTGKVAEPRIVWSDLSKEANACVLKQVATWVFAPRPAATELRRELLFTGSPRFGQPMLPRSPQRAAMEDLGVPVPPSPACVARRCSLKTELDTLCAAYAKAHQRLVAGASWADTTAPIVEAVKGLCCTELEGAMRASDNLYVPDKRTVWCLAVNGFKSQDEGGPSTCGVPECAGFNQFWKAWNRQPETWFPALASKPSKP